jgi:hypothetical protein
MLTHVTLRLQAVYEQEQMLSQLHATVMLPNPYEKISHKDAYWNDLPLPGKPAALLIIQTCHIRKSMSSSRSPSNPLEGLHYDDG